jgi:hypothetical protein
MVFFFTDGLFIPFFNAGWNFSRNVSPLPYTDLRSEGPRTRLALEGQWVFDSGNATTVQRDEEDQMTAVEVGVGVGEYVLVDVNPHLRSRSVSEDNMTSESGSGNVTPKREVVF